MSKKAIWILVIIVVGLVIIAGAGFGTVYYLGKKAASMATLPPSATLCTECELAPVDNGELTFAEIEANHCLKDPNGGTDNITIADIAHYSEVANPIAISGTANVFEGSFIIRLVGCDGQEIARVIGQAEEGEIGISSPYTATLTYPASFSGSYAYIEAFDLSARDGSVADLIQVPVKLK